MDWYAVRRYNDRYRILDPGVLNFQSIESHCLIQSSMVGEPAIVSFDKRDGGKREEGGKHVSHDASGYCVRFGTIRSH